MPLREAVILTVLPNGWSTSGKLQATVVVSLQASPPEPVMLGAAVPLLRNWADPAHWTEADALSFGLGLSSELGMAETHVDATRVGPLPDPQLWAALFPPDETPLAAFPPPKPLPDKDHILTYGGAKIADFARDQYSDPEMIAASQASHPQQDWLAQPNRFLPFIDRHLTAPAVPPGAAAAPEMGSHSAAFESARALDFVQRPPAVPGPRWQAFDFHDMIAALGHYHSLMRRLGLVFDLEATVPEGTQAKLVILTTDARHIPDPPRFVTPFTQCLLDATRFVAAPGPRGTWFASSFRELKLNSEDTPFVLSEVDALGAAVRFDALGQKMARALNARAPEDATLGLPALRTGGISLFRSEPDHHVDNLQAQVNESVDRHRTELQQAPGAEPGLHKPFCAEDLVRGYLLDVRDPASGKWRSVNRRAGTLHVTNAPALSLELPPDDEGCVGESLARVAGAEDTAYMENALLRWNGWSLIVPMPLGTVEEAEPDADTTDKLASSVRAELTVPAGSLPRLRFGQTYQFRVRTMDIAGNALPSQATVSDEASSKPITYGRLEPVPPPVLALKTQPGPGESLAIAIVRSNGTEIDGLPPAERHVLPPQAAIFTLERHGAFDDTANPNFATREATWERLTRADQSLGLWTNPDVLPAELGSNPAALAVKKAAIQQAQLHPQNVVQVPYLPDVMAQAVAIRVVEGMEWFDNAEPPRVEQQSFVTGQGFWPDTVRSVTLQVFPGNQGDPAVLRKTTEGDAAFQLFLPPAAVVKLRITSVPSELRLSHLKVFQWLSERLGSHSAQLAILRESILNGGVPVVTPFEDVTARHSVSVPLLVPQAVLAANRSPRVPTNINVYGAVVVDHASTDHVTFYAEWIDFNDAPGTPPAFHSMRAVLDTLTIDIKPPQAGPHLLRLLIEGTFVSLTLPGVGLSYMLHMRDAAARVLALSAVASPRFRGDFAHADERFPFSDFVLSAGSAKLAPEMPLGSAEAQAIEEAWHTHIVANGDKAWALDRDISAAAPPPHVQPVPIRPLPPGPDGLVSQVSIGAPVIEIVPSTAPPAPPRVEQVVPGFVLSRESPQPQPPGTRQAVSRRQGNRLRVWLARPFHGSGYPEELAVVLPEHAVNIPQDLEKLVTLWGADLATGISNQAQRDLDFPLAHPTPSQSYPLPGLPGGSVRARIAPHLVAYDAASDRYYCDILVSGLEAMYMPFIRLVLATFQRAALPGHELSHIVMAGTLQLLPDRTASLEVAADHSLWIAVRGTQPEEMERYGAPGVDGLVPGVTRGMATLVTAQVESRPAGSTDDPGDLDWAPHELRQRSLAVAAFRPDPLNPNQRKLLISRDWRGTISRDPGITGDHAWRLAVREYEFSSEGTIKNPVATRLVFAEHFDLPEWATPAPQPPPLPSGARGWIVWPNNKVHMFKETQFYSYTINGEGGVDPGCPKPIAGNLQGLADNFPEGIDTGVVWPNGKAYFFKGNQYVRCTIKPNGIEPNGSVDEGYPQPIAGNWPRLADKFPDGVDAVFVYKDKAYFFKGMQYVQYNIGLPGSGAEGVDPGYPKPIAGDWPGLAEHLPNGIDAAAHWPTSGKIYFFKGDQYIRYSMENPKGVDPGFPQQIGAKII